MAIKIRRFEPQDAAPIERLNRRLEAHGVSDQVFPEQPSDCEGDVVRSRLFVAVEGGEIRGGVWLQEQDFWIAGEVVRAGWAKYPVSESLIDSRFGGVPGGLLMRLLREQPRLMALGLGGHHTPFAQLLARLKWQASTVPFYVFPARPARVLRRLEYIRRTPLRRLLLDLLAWSGLGWAGVKLVGLLRATFRPRGVGDYAAEVESEFGPWADEVWARARADYGFSVMRDRRALNAFYTDRFSSLIRLRVRRSGSDVGWACVLTRDRRAGGHSPFGDLTVGMIADGFAAPQHALGVTAAATRYLRQSGVDLMVSNQAHPQWRAALRALGFFPAPSNFAFYRSPQVTDLVARARSGEDRFHLNRGDCDGPGWR